MLGPADFNPFLDQDCIVIDGNHVRVVRISARSSNGEIARYRKTFKSQSTNDFTWFNTHECDLLLEIRHSHVTRTVQPGSLIWNAQGGYDSIETLDVGPSLAHWVFIKCEGDVHTGAVVHPFQNPYAVLHVLRSALLALHEIHSNGFVHCDIREDNVCVGFKRHPINSSKISPNWNDLKLIDFAFSLSKSKPLSQPLPIDPKPSLHSPAFMAALDSDIRLGRPSAVPKLDWRIDIYALGMMMERVLANVRQQWDSNDGAMDVDALVTELVQKMKAIDSDKNSTPNLQLHHQFLEPIDRAIASHGHDGIHWVIPTTLPSQSESPQFREAVKPTPIPPSYNVAPTPISSISISTGTGVVPPQSGPVMAPNKIVASTSVPIQVSKRSVIRTVQIPAQSKISLLAKLWLKLKDSLTLELSRRAAAKGDPVAAYRVGCALLRGHAVTQDLRAAYQWLLLAAEKGNSNAQAAVGALFDQGLGVAEDPTIAAYWYQRAAEQGHPIGHYGLGVLLEQGRGTKRDEAAAITQIKTAATLGSVDAYFALGQMISTGHGITKDRDAAIECFRRGAELGSGPCAYSLGQMYESSNSGTPATRNLSLDWYKRALKMGEFRAQEAIARVKLRDH